MNDGDTTKITYSEIEFDSLTGKYLDVKKIMHMGYGFEGEIDRKPIDPVLFKKSKKLTAADWNRLTNLIGSTSFYEMFPADTITSVLDGNHYLLEVHSANGYYVVERWSPEEGKFKKILDYIVGLSDYRSEDY